MEITKYSQLDSSKTYYYTYCLILKIKDVSNFLREQFKPFRLLQRALISVFFGRLGVKIYNFLEDTPCGVYFAPSDMCLERNINDFYGCTTRCMCYLRPKQNRRKKERWFTRCCGENFISRQFYEGIEEQI